MTKICMHIFNIHAMNLKFMHTGACIALYMQSNMWCNRTGAIIHGGPCSHGGPCIYIYGYTMNLDISISLSICVCVYIYVHTYTVFLNISTLQWFPATDSHCSRLLMCLMRPVYNQPLRRGKPCHIFFSYSSDSTHMLPRRLFFSGFSSIHRFFHRKPGFG